MNTTFTKTVFLSLLALTGILISCRKNDVRVPDVSEKIAGVYELVRIQWDGDPVDVNNDGVTGNNLYPELMTLSTNAQGVYKTQVLVSDSSSGSIGMYIPLQNVSVTHDGRYPKGFMTGMALPLSLLFHIDREGSISVDHFDSLDVPESESRIEMKRIHDGQATFDELGHFVFTVHNTLYDHATDQLVDGIITYTYTRVQPFGTI